MLLSVQKQYSGQHNSVKNEPHKLVQQLIVMLLHFQRKLILFQKSYKGTREGNIFKGRNWETTGAVDARSCLNLLLLLWNDLSYNFLRSSAYFCGNRVWFIQDWHWSPVSYSGSPVLTWMSEFAITNYQLQSQLMCRQKAFPYRDRG